jgi:hypothetical protein
MKSIILGCAILIFSTFGAYAEVTNAQLVGGAGGAPFDDACGQGDVLIGYNIISGKAMNTFAAVCQPQSGGVLIGKNYGLRTWGKDSNEGVAFETSDVARCPAGTAISALTILVNKFNELDSVSATCSPLLRNTVGISFLTSSGSSGGQAFRQGQSECRPGTVAVGVFGRSGALMDALGLKCAPPPWLPVASQTPPAPSPSPMPPSPPKPTPPSSAQAQPCPSGLVWRERFDGDTVCVTPGERDDNRRRRGLPVSVSNCPAGLVWREQYDGDTFCVTPVERDANRRRRGLPVGQ